MAWSSGDKQPLPWEMRLRVTNYIAQALDHYNTENRKIYHDLNAYRILFDEALDLIRGKNVLLLMDSSLEGQYANEDATKLVELASKCLRSEARDRPNTKFLLSAVAPLQKQSEVASHVIMGLMKAVTQVPLPTMLSPLGKACARMDLTVVHDILLKTSYEDKEGAENEVRQSFSGLLLLVVSLETMVECCFVFYG